MKLQELFEDKVLEWFENSPLFEMAFSRKEVESKITNLGSPIIKHLIKIIKWEDEINYEKHCNDITEWFYQVQRMKLKNDKRPLGKDYYKWLFVDNVEDENEIIRWIRSLSNYHQLKSKSTDSEVYQKINIIIQKISNDLSKNRFEDIRHYL